MIPRQGDEEVQGPEEDSATVHLNVVVGDLELLALKRLAFDNSFKEMLLFQQLHVTMVTSNFCIFLGNCMFLFTA